MMIARTFALSLTALLALSLTAPWVLAADVVPKFDVAPSCRGAAAAGFIATGEERLKICLNAEQRARDELEKNWTAFPAADRAYCLALIRHFQPTYTELATCLDLKRYAREIKPEPEAKPGRR
jgi:hypothetical protein